MLISPGQDINFRKSINIGFGLLLVLEEIDSQYYLNVYELSSGTRLASSGDLLKPYFRLLQEIVAECGKWLLVFDPNVPTFEGTDVRYFNRGEAYVYDRFASEIILYTFQCEPRPNDCGQEPSGNNVVTEDGDAIIVSNGGKFSSLILIRSLSFSSLNS